MLPRVIEAQYFHRRTFATQSRSVLMNWKRQHHLIRRFDGTCVYSQSLLALIIFEDCPDLSFWKVSLSFRVSWHENSYSIMLANWLHFIHRQIYERTKTCSKGSMKPAIAKYPELSSDRSSTFFLDNNRRWETNKVSANGQ